MGAVRESHGTVSVERVSIKLGHQQVLTTASLDAHPGEILGLLGPSGAGKTTLLRLILGSLRAESGSVTVAGHLMPSGAPIRSIGYMPQNDAVYTDITGEANLRFFGSLFGLTNTALSVAIDRALELVNLGAERDKMVANYSGGMRKRLSLAIALLHDPEILLLDEPTVGIDPMLRREVWDEFRALAAAGKTLIISTHVLDEIDRCDRAALVYRGTVIHEDSVDALKQLSATGSLEDLFLAEGGDVV